MAKRGFRHAVSKHRVHVKPGDPVKPGDLGKHRVHLGHRVLAPLAAIALLPLAGLMSGCGIVGGDSGPAQAAMGTLETSTLNVAAVPSVDSAGFFVALYTGLFRQEGLTIHYSPALSGDTVINAQMNGLYDITAGNYVSYVEHDVFQHQPLDIIAEGSLMRQGSQAIYTLPGSPIKTLTDLRGHLLGTNAPKNINYLLAASVLTEDGISPASVHFTTRPVAFPDLVTALATHKVDAASLPEPFATIAEESLGATAVADMNVGATQNFPILGYVATRAWAQTHPNTLRAFLTALEAGQRIADTNRAEVEAAMEALTSTKPLIADVMTFNSYPIGVDRVRLQRVPNVMFQFGILSRPFDIGQMLGS